MLKIKINLSYLKTRKLTGARCFIGVIAALIIGGSASALVKEGFYQVRRVVDGDTVELSNGSKVRYIGINTPETMKKISGKWIFSPEFFGVEAKKFNRDLIGEGKVRLELDKDKTDKYGRILAYVFASDGGMVNAELIRNGLATVYTFYPNVKYLDRYLELQKEAVAEKRGLWGELKTIPFVGAYRDIGQMRKVQGKVSGIHITRDSINLDFTENGESIFTAEIPLRNIPLFTQRGIDPNKYYLEKNISVIGRIKDGPSIYVDNPLQIELQ